MDAMNRKNTYELLSMSDSDSGTPQHMPELGFKSPRRKRLRKKLPAYRVKRYDESSDQRCCQPYGKQLSLSFIIVILCCWLLILSWLVVIFNDELKRFDNSLMQFASGNVPESLQKCHQETKELQRNQSDLYSHFVKLNSKLTNLTSEILVISKDLSTVRSKLNVSIGPDVPINAKDVQENINQLHSWIKELNETVVQLKVSEDRLENDFHAMNLNLTSLKEKLLKEVPSAGAFSAADTELANDTQKFISILSKLTNNITYINNSLTSEIQLMKEEHIRDHETLDSLTSFANNNLTVRLDLLEAEYNALSHKLTVDSNVTNQPDASSKEHGKESKEHAAPLPDTKLSLEISTVSNKNP